MYSNEDGDDNDRVTIGAGFRHVMIFQLKLAADALRDFLLSPLSLVAFALDAITRPKVEHSLYLRLMLLGRRSDRMINLFDDHADSGELTIDRAVDELEDLLRTAQGDRSGGNASPPSEEESAGESSAKSDSENQFQR